MSKLPADLQAIVEAIKKVANEGASPEEVLAKARKLILEGDEE